MAKQKKNKKWCKFRHKVVRTMLGWTLGVYTKLAYGLKVERFRQENRRQYLVLSNHQTGFDQFFVGLAFRQPIYYVASEDIFSMGFVSRLIQYLVAPIPIKKQVTDVRAVMNCMKVSKEGGSIAIFPEGNRTFSGITGAMNPAIVGLIKRLKLPVAFFKIEGGYGIQPRWSDVRRKGKMKAYVSCVMEPEEYQALDNTALFERIQRELYQNEANSDNLYEHEQSAEFVERVLYLCPTCGITHFRSQGDTVECTTCGKKARYLPNTELSGEDFPFRYVADWYEYQQRYVNNMNMFSYVTEPIIQDRCSVYQVELYKKKKCLAEDVQLMLYGDRLEFRGGFCLQVAFAKAQTITILGKNKLNIYYEDNVYQIQGDKRFNALKYLNLYHRYMNLATEGVHGEFLGL